MNIVYGVSGEGLGHVFEAVEIAARLQREGHVVRVLTYGDRACTLLKDYNPTRIAGIHLHFKPGGMSLFDTTVKNLRIFPFYLRNWRRLKRELTAFRPDVFITAYEPFSTFASHALKRPLISMDNQNELLHVNVAPGSATFALKVAQLATRVCTYGAAHYIVKSFDKPDHGGQNVHFVSPVVQGAIRGLRPRAGQHVLVYLTKPNPDLIGVLKTMGETFVVYCNNRVGEDGNISYRAPGEGYLRDLCDCKAIIGTTGFSLIADAIYLKKPYYGVPLRKQFEQTHNARFLSRSGLGDFSENPSAEDLGRFLASLQTYRERLARHHLDPAEQVEVLLALLREVGSGTPGPPCRVIGVRP
ncbi:MAG TPA: glycosyltransferase family protein [Opitutaceae bacterium]|nr:glycosyltransferase family protein [Opitutaceae bacterium]